MGSYAECSLGPFCISYSKNDVDPFVMGLFRAADKVVTCDLEALPAKLRDLYRGEVTGAEDDPPNPKFPFVFYRVPLSVARDRLEVRGYTLAAAREAFAECIALELSESRQSAQRHPELYEPHVSVLEQLTVECWQGALKQMAEDGLPLNQRGSTVALAGEVLQYLKDSSTWYGYPGLDTNVPLRIAMEVCSECDELIYDLTDLVWSESVDPNDDFVENALQTLANEHITNARTVVLTEGRFDAFVLRESLELLYPHLRDYYSFMDFESYDPEGGAAALVKQVKAFAAAGILNKIIAVFDNDAASRDAMRSLNAIRLPSNIQIMHLPEIGFLREYPTLGPTGELKMNVNGLAASIELYLGKDVLTDPSSGDLVPVQWKGYIVAVRQYQGEVLKKKDVQERFRGKLSGAADGGVAVTSCDWEGVSLVLQRIFAAFHQQDARAIKDLIKWQYAEGYSRM
ncbi:MAG: HEPN/Toprim-associated domain-containing protein [Acidobacteriaceae bacterium]